MEECSSYCKKKRKGMKKAMTKRSQLIKKFCFGKVGRKNDVPVKEEESK